jgi:hypothetical protein
MLSRAAMDGNINGWKNSHKSAQAAHRVANGHYGQVLRGGGQPSDQAVPGPALPNPHADSEVHVYDGPNGRGWVGVFWAEEAGTTYTRTVTCHEDGPLVETDWAEDQEVPYA